MSYNSYTGFGFDFTLGPVTISYFQGVASNGSYTYNLSLGGFNREIQGSYSDDNVSIAVGVGRGQDVLVQGIDVAGGNAFAGIQVGYNLQSGTIGLDLAANATAAINPAISTVLFPSGTNNAVYYSFNQDIKQEVSGAVSGIASSITSGADSAYKYLTAPQDTNTPQNGDNITPSGGGDFGGGGANGTFPTDPVNPFNLNGQFYGTLDGLNPTGGPANPNGEFIPAQTNGYGADAGTLQSFGLGANNGADYFGQNPGVVSQGFGDSYVSIPGTGGFGSGPNPFNPGSSLEQTPGSANFGNPGSGDFSSSPSSTLAHKISGPITSRRTPVRCRKGLATIPEVRLT